MPQGSKGWRFAVDRGGTFTDVIGVDPRGAFHTLKLLSASSGYADASIEGVKKILGLNSRDPLPEDVIDGIRFGTTVATNALLENKGGRVALFVTRGFADLLDIGYQNRPDIFRLCIQKPAPLYSAVIEVVERLDSRGEVITAPDMKKLRDEIRRLKKKGFDTAAVALMHSWVNPSHEIACGEVLKKCGFLHIFLSHRASNHVKLVSRGHSTVVDAYLCKVLTGHVQEISGASGSIQIEFMQSSGALTDAHTFSGKNAILSGPAGGVIAVGRVAEDKDIPGLIGFDMGGTSTDVSRFEGAFEKVYEQVISGIPLQAEMLNLITIAAGGGSILRFDGQKMTVGPDSAGSEPGPASYGLGGPLTLTDANLFTGRLVPRFFPRAFGRDGNQPLDLQTVRRKFHDITDTINDSSGTSLTPQETAAGFLTVANEIMAAAIKEISVSKGFNIRQYALLSFGGAGGQHACAIASLLDITKTIIHPLSGLMSAYGIGLSYPARSAARTLLLPYTKKTHDLLTEMFTDMVERLTVSWQKEGKPFTVRREVGLRPHGTETFLTLAYNSYRKTSADFNREYIRLFGFAPEDVPLELVNLRVEAIETTTFFPRYKRGTAAPVDMPEAVSSQEVYFAGRAVPTPVYPIESLPAGTGISGPAIILDQNSTIVVNPEFEAEIDADGILTLTTKMLKEDVSTSIPDRPDPVLLEVFNNLFMSTATEMGISLQQTAYSVNMKERLDFSCALFDANGDLVANAPHIPVHLGAMADTVKAVIEDSGCSMKPGNIYLTNNPYRGGSHLSDMTVVCPVFSEEGKRIFFTAARGHHSDIGGVTAGSMPSVVSHIDEEGVLIDHFLLVSDGTFQETGLRELLANHRFPVRNISERIHDVTAQIAACMKGAQELHEVTARYGLKTVLKYMRYIQENAEYSVKRALNRLLHKKRAFQASFEDLLDDGTPIRASITISPGDKPPDSIRALIDFSGTGRQHTADNLNAPPSVTRSAVMYVLRTLIETAIPLNSGCLKPVSIIIPQGTILNPEFPYPVASGNVETSQRVVDVLLGALGIAAASQGTMNNLLFQVDGEPPYYETIAGGAGATAGCHGASGVQVHMTNTRITDPEILEHRHPGIRLIRFKLRRGSGGDGHFRGGDGIVREILFLKPATASIISERRVYPPYGLQGGSAGEKGINMHQHKHGKRRVVGHREVITLKPGDSIIIETPGGGGFGKP